MLSDAPRSSAVPTAPDLQFGPFRLRGPHGPLLSGDRSIELPRKALALLWLLASRAGEVVTKDELLAAIWPRVVVNEGAISGTLRDLRRALGDDAREPRFIATAHRIGYRFIAGVSTGGDAGERSEAARPAPTPVPANDPGPASEPALAAAFGRNAAADAIVGRTAELAQLAAAHGRALSGQRQVVFVTGEAGIGKSRLVETFLASVEALPGVAADRALVGHGQCIEHYGAGEPYLPVLEAVTRLCRQPGGAPFAALLRRHAPTWLAQLPGLFGDDDGAPPPHAAAAGSVERMLREMADAIDLAAAERPLVLVFEDMHWSDRSTVDWLAMLARRREPARLLVLATCRPVELIVNQHPLKQVKQDLLARRAASDVVLGRLAAPEVRRYVERWLGDGPAGGVADAVFRRSQGHPLFMVHLADDLRRRPDASAVLDDALLPCGVTDLIESQLSRLAPDELDVLEAASVIGAEFAAAGVTAALQRPDEAVEPLLEAMALRSQFIEARGLVRWHAGTVSGRYGFRHDLVRDALYRRLGTARRMRLHRAIGERLAAASGDHAGEIAAELALHFENAHDPARAARHRADAGDRALRRCAHREALAHAERGLALLDESAADVAEREATELRLRLVQGAALLATCGYGAPEVEAAYTRTLALALARNDPDAIGPALSGLYNLYLTRAAFSEVKAIAEQVLTLLDVHADSVLSMLAHNVRGTAHLFMGEAAAALPHVDRTLALYDANLHRHLAVTYGEDPAVASHHYAALGCWVLGRAESAERHLRDGFARAERLDHPFGRAQMLWMEAVIALDDGDLDRVDRSTARLEQVCLEYGFVLWLAGGRILRGAALVGRGQHGEGRRITELGLVSWREAGTLLTLPHALAVAARVEVLSGRPEAAARLLDDAIAIVERTGERWYEAELHRLVGELALRLPESGATGVARARERFERAIAIADAQQARTFELRATASLAALSLPPDESAQVRSRLAAAAARMTEGRDRRDMQRAAALLGAR